MSWTPKDALNSTDAEVLDLLKQAAAVIQCRPETHRKWTVRYALTASLISPEQGYDQASQHFEAVYDAHTAELEATQPVLDPSQWTEAQRRMRH